MNQTNNTYKRQQPAPPQIAGRGPGAHMRGIQPPPIENPSKTIKKLWQYLKPYKKTLITVFAAVTISTILGLIAPLYLKKAIDTITTIKTTGSMHSVLTAIITMASLYLISALLTWIQISGSIKAAQGALYNIREKSFRKLHRLPIPYLDRTPHGDIMSRFTNDVDTLTTAFTQTLTQLFSNILMLTGSIIMMLLLSPILTLLTMIIIPLAILATKIIATTSRKQFRRQQETIGKLNSIVEESAGGLREIKAFGKERELLDNFIKTNNNYADAAFKAMFVSSILPPIMNAINGLSFAIIATAGGYLAIKGILTVGIVAAFLTYSRQFSRPINEIANQFTMIQSAIAGAERIFQLQEETEEKEKQNALTKFSAEGKLKLSKVNFSYIPEKKVLTDIDLTAEAGEKIAIVGPTGAGKTTIVNLLMRFYTPQEGKIELDSTDIENITRAALRKNIGMVLQDTYLFSGTIADNIRYAKPNADMDQVIRAAKLAEADSFIRHLPDGYNTQLTDSGASLSQGQRQLITIARAILADPAILILDEATSNVDTRTETHIQKALKTLLKGRTSLVIAHRLGTIRDADKICVIENGRIIEQGSHEELMQKQGAYYRLYQNHYKKQEQAI
ncbi:ABC transporter ATP-binding protein [Spirochaetia bacterium 38H-sp]|uniref:ABC transporter ATP-binding protein n=1 Tax=Rarispira pelagica TaxID=3141764 RepID=A0ABU9UBQ5_9SPIR